MAEIIHLRDDPHQSTQILLPWYVSTQLEGDDIALVETHLGECGECRRALEDEQRLKAAMNALPLLPDLGWEKLQCRLASDMPAGRKEAKGRTRSWRGVGLIPALAAFAVAQLIVLALALPLLRTVPSSGDYHTLGAPPLRSGGNILILFRPDTNEEDMRFALARAGATITGGPTTAGAYVVDVEATRREAALMELRAQPNILVAQPIEPDSAP